MFFYILLFFFAFIIIFWLISWIRWETGTDWETYCPFFQENYSLSEFMDPSHYTMEDGYRFYNYIIKQLSSSYTFLLLITSSLIFAVKESFFVKYSPLPLISLLACYALSRGDIFYTRQTISCHICFLASTALLSNKKLLFLLLIVLASTFHSAALSFLIMYPIIKYNSIGLKKLMLSTIVLSLLCFFIGAMIMSELSSFAPGLISYKIDRYMEAGDSMQTGQSLTTLLINGIINRGFFFILFSIAAKQFYHDKIFRFFFLMYCALMVLFFLTVSINVSLTRIVIFFEISQYILIAYFFKTKACKNKQLWVLLVGFYLFVRFYTSTLNGFYKDAFIPLKTVFDYI